MFDEYEAIAGKSVYADKGSKSIKGIATLLGVGLAGAYLFGKFYQNRSAIMDALPIVSQIDRSAAELRAMEIVEKLTN